MDHSEDVERLFSWLKAPLVHYREFAPQREVADAVATWPVAHRAAVQAGVAAAAGPAPQGDTVAKERLARDRMTLPTRPVQHVPSAEAAPYDPPPEPTAEGAAETGATADLAPAGDRQPIPAAAAGEPAAARPVAAAPEITGFEPPPPPRPAATRPTPGRLEDRPDERWDEGSAPRQRQQEPPRHYPARDRGALFGGEYRSREPATSRVADRQDRSLEAVFSRLAGGRDRLPDPRARARTNPGLGPLFNRLR